MAREDERILESFLNRGVPELAARDIQRANAPRLGAAVATSRATRANVARSRQAGIQGRALSQRSSALRGLSRRRGQGAQGGSQGLAVIRNLSNPATPGSLNQKFEVQVAGASGVPSFSTLEEAVEFLRSRGLLQGASFAGPGQIAPGSDLLQRVQAAGLNLISGQQTGSPQDLLNQFRSQGAGLVKQTQTQKELEENSLLRQLLQRDRSFDLERQSIARAGAARGRFGPSASTIRTTAGVGIRR